MYHYTSMHTHRGGGGGNQKVFILRSSPIWHMRSSTYLSYILINDICLFKLFYFNSIDIKVPREPIGANHTFPLMQETLTNTGITRISSMHLIIIGISYHIYTHISATRCKRSLVTQQNVLNQQWVYLNWVLSQKLIIGFKFTDVELLGQFFRRYSLFQVKDPQPLPPPCLIATVPIDPELTTP